MIRTLALDQASRVTGYAIFEDKKLIKYGTFTAQGSDLGYRLVYIRDWVESLIKTYDINKIIMEDIQLESNIGNNVATFKILAEVFGVIYELATELQIPNSAVLSPVWRSGLKINDAKKREIQKKNAQKYVLEKYNIKASEDECDAICIGTYAVGGGAAADYNWD